MKHRWLMSINLYAYIMNYEVGTPECESWAQQAYADNSGWGINGWEVWALGNNN